MTDTLAIVAQEATEQLQRTHAARELALPKARALIRLCANSIRATHRHDLVAAEGLLSQAAALAGEIAADLRDHQDIYFAGFVQDAQKEYAEAATFFALSQHLSLPRATDLAIGWAAYLNGLGETVGELRRYILDQLRRGQLDTCEPYLRAMDDIYALLTSIDFPDAITMGLRRTTDSARGILEKTRGDLTVAFSQAQLQRAMLDLRQELQDK